ncbi:MAG: XRE family transcriptional regulator [Microscillaceae bacterium]|nr:XRE family transcriptional regulator [Microscillaceae bacterium]MDW8461534.1 XRE family transcriptional regulator [Cytophagales bacterium]
MFLSKNLRYLRQKNGKQSQEELAQRLNVTRSVISSYEDGRAEPSIATLNKIANYFGLSLENLVNTDLEKTDLEQMEYKKQIHHYASAKNLRINSTIITQKNREEIPLVAEKAAAGYTAGFADLNYIEKLPKYNLPFLTKGRLYRAFQIQGDSMLPIPSGSIIIAEKLEQTKDVKDGQPCIVVLKSEGIVFKKVYNRIAERGTFLLKSTNVIYAPYEVAQEEVLEIWKFVAYISRQLPMCQDSIHSIQNLKEVVFRLEEQITALKS